MMDGDRSEAPRITDVTTAPSDSDGTRARRLFSDAAWFSVLFGLTNVLSYVYIVAAGRHLLDAAFGVFNALLGVLTLAGVIANSVQTAVTAIAVRDPSRATLASVNRRIAVLSVPVIAAATFAGTALAGRFGADAAQIAACGLVTLALQLAYPSVGFMIGLGMVRQQAWIGLLGAVARLTLGIPLMAGAGGVVAGLAGYFANYLVVLVAAATLAWRHARARLDDVATSTVLRVDRATMATYIAVFLPFSLDQLLVQLVAPQHGGVYAALSTMSKLVFFGAYPLIATVFPEIVRRREVGAQLRVAGLALMGVAVVAGGSAAVLAAFPRQILALFFAERFTEASQVLPTLVIGAFAFTMSVLAAHLLIAWRSRWAPAASLVPCIVGTTLYALDHGSLGALVSNQFTVYAMQLALMAALVAVEAMRRRRR